ncbi:GNAT family N-acetyltransferase [Myxococcota bacterium]|nr:GNAT family N-acetyltransferase [Myxococcota bacterium]
MAPPTIRAARADDHAAFARLFPELAVDDPTPDAQRFEREILRGCLVGEVDGRVAAYVWYQLLEGSCYVRHLVVGPEARRTGLGRALMERVRALALAAGATRWMLNVKPDNVPAIRLYEACGMRFEFGSKALRIRWADVDALVRSHGTTCTARLVEPSEDARVEAASGLIAGQLRDARTTGDRVLVVAERGAEIAGAAIFNPSFPGAYPFRAPSLDAAIAMLVALRPHKRAEDDVINLVLEDQAATADALITAGATVRLDILHYSGPLA